MASGKLEKASTDATSTPRPLPSSQSLSHGPRSFPPLWPCHVQAHPQPVSPSTAINTAKSPPPIRNLLETNTLRPEPAKHTHENHGQKWTFSSPTFPLLPNHDLSPKHLLRATAPFPRPPSKYTKYRPKCRRTAHPLPNLLKTIRLLNKGHNHPREKVDKYGHSHPLFSRTSSASLLPRPLRSPRFASPWTNMDIFVRTALPVLRASLHPFLFPSRPLRDLRALRWIIRPPLFTPSDWQTQIINNLPDFAVATLSRFRLVCHHLHTVPLP